MLMSYKHLARVVYVAIDCAESDVSRYPALINSHVEAKAHKRHTYFRWGDAMANAQRGQMVERGDGVWLLRVYMGRVDGKRKYSSKTLRGTTTQARKELTKMLSGLDTGTYVASSKMTVQEYVTEWLDTKADVAEQTRLDYGDRMKSDVYPTIGGLRLSKLGPGHVRQLYSNLTTERKLSPRTIRYTHTVLNQALEYAVEDGLMQRNPCGLKSVRQAIPKKVKTEPTIFTPTEVNTILDSASKGDTQQHALWRVLLTAGLRPQEALALKWSDLDGEFLTIQRASHRVAKGARVITDVLKSDASRRIVPLSQETLDVLGQHRAEQAARILKAGPAYVRSNLVFATGRGTVLDTSNVSGWWKTVLVVAGVAHRRLYDCRHTHLSHAYSVSKDAKGVAERGGHNPVTFMNVYAHTLPGTGEKIADGAEQLLRLAR